MIEPFHENSEQLKLIVVSFISFNLFFRNTSEYFLIHNNFYMSFRNFSTAPELARLFGE